MIALSDQADPKRRDEQGVASPLLWFVVLGGPLAWLLDESIALVIAARVCGSAAGGTPGYARVVLVIVALTALAVVVAALTRGWRWLRSTRDRGAASRREGRIRFMVVAGLLISGLALFGVALRLVASLASSICA